MANCHRHHKSNRNAGWESLLYRWCIAMYRLTRGRRCSLLH